MPAGPPIGDAAPASYVPLANPTRLLDTRPGAPTADDGPDGPLWNGQREPLT